MKEISREKLAAYFDITEEALLMASQSPKVREKEATICLDMARRYVEDAHHFKEKGEWVLAYGALNYAHGWLDCAARLGFFIVKDDRLFTVDS